MAFNFPNSPSLNDTHTIGDKTWIWTGAGWKLQTSAAAASGNSFGIIYTSNNSVFANSSNSNDQITFTGVNGVAVEANATTKVITFAGTPGAQGLTIDYGSVTESIAYSLDYGTL